MNDKELRRGEVLGRVKRGELKLSEAAQMLEISYRQTKRIWRRYAAGRDESIEARQRGPGVEPSQARGSSQASAATGARTLLRRAARALQANAGGRTFVDRPRSETIGADTAALDARRRKRKAHRKRRQRKAHFGELIQVDGSHHQWLEGRGSKGCLMTLRRRCDRCGAGALLRRGNDLGGGRSARSLGAPVRRSQGAVLRLEERLQAQPTSREAIEGIESETQFGRMCAKLGIRIIAASSPQAKGRVERSRAPIKTA